MKKYKILYIDEERKELREFIRNFDQQFEVETQLPGEDMDEMIRPVIDNTVDALIVDHSLSDYRIDVKVHITYTGSDIIEEVKRRKNDFPCFILTSYDVDAAQNLGDVNDIYPKAMRNPECKYGKLTLQETIRFQIEHYKNRIKEKKDRLCELLEKNEKDGLSLVEENELLDIDNYLERTIAADKALPRIKKEEIAFEKINALIDFTKKLLECLKEED
ncbi:MAG: hypothetical protein KAI43_08245 [Candidatus Aureabacteria bacterium]|nr:hypothetical protein [Candidatus Auribacterota bacterium]